MPSVQVTKHGYRPHRPIARKLRITILVSGFLVRCQKASQDDEVFPWVVVDFSIRDSIWVDERGRSGISIDGISHECQEGLVGVWIVNCSLHWRNWFVCSENVRPVLLALSDIEYRWIYLESSVVLEEHLLG